MFFRALSLTLGVAFIASFVQLAPGTTALAIDLQPTTTIYLPNSQDFAMPGCRVKRAVCFLASPI